MPDTWLPMRKARQNNVLHVRVQAKRKLAGVLMKILTVVLMLLCFAGAADAQKCSTHQRTKNPLTWFKSNMCADDYEVWLQDHEPKAWYGSKQWWLSLGVMGAAIAADAYTTANPCKGCVESNTWLIGKHPSPGAVAGEAALNFSVQTGLHLWSYNLGKRDPSSAWRFTSLWAQPMAVGAMGGYFAHRNANLGHVDVSSNPMYQVKRP